MEEEEVGEGVISSCVTSESILLGGGGRRVGMFLLSCFTLIGTGCIFFLEYLTILDDFGIDGSGKAS